MKRLTKKEALELSLIQWRWLADKPEQEKSSYFGGYNNHSIYGVREEESANIPEDMCYLCEYVVQRGRETKNTDRQCKELCLLYDSFVGDSVIHNMTVPCENSHFSAYRAWEKWGEGYRHRLNIIRDYPSDPDELSDEQADQILLAEEAEQNTVAAAEKMVEALALALTSIENK